MQSASDRYEDPALAYTRLVRQESQEAAAAVDQIHVSWSPLAALQVALIIRIVKMEVQQNHWRPNIDIYDHLLADYPEALPLMHYALIRCLQSWGVSVPEPPGWAEVAIAELRAKPLTARG